MRWTSLLCGTAALTLAGCANLLSISRETDVVSIRDFDNKKDAKVVHLDAKQRLVFSDSRALCAEPSPDALSALAASAGGGLTFGQETGSLTQAFAESAGSIGLRTQSITLMRDTLYRMCEAFHNYALDSNDYVQLLQRSQDLTLGVLAIEQLTGVAIANQAALGGDANAGAASAMRATQEMLQKADEDLAKAREEKGVADDKVKATEKEIEDFGDPGDDAEKKAKKQQLAQQLERDKTDQKAKGDMFKQAEESKKVIERNRDAAFSQAHAAAGGHATLTSPSQGGAKLSDASTGQIADAVERIVASVIGKNHLLDNCVNVLSKTDKKLGALDETTRNSLTNYCSKVVEADIRMRDRSNQAQAKAYEGFYSGATPRPKPNGTEKPPIDKLSPPPSGVY